MDDVIVMNDASLEKFSPRVRPGGRLLVNSSIARKEILRTDITVIKAPVTVIPGENEMRALAEGVLRVLRGEETVRRME